MSDQAKLPCDKVIVRRAGDVIPAVIKPIEEARPEWAQPWRMPEVCPACGSHLERLPGEADYALANAALVEETERWRLDHPHCRCLAVEWSVWSGIGMGERLGSVEALTRRGIE